MKMPIHNKEILRNLTADFSVFRAHRRPYARVPQRLRQSVLAAIASGLSAATIAGSLGLSASQIASWRRRTSKELDVIAPIERPRILTVTPDEGKSGLPTGLRVSYESGRLLLELSF